MGSLEKILFASCYCGSQTFQKTSLFFGSYFASLYKPRQACQDGRLEAWRTNRNPSVPCLGLLFLNSPPILFSVNHLSIRLPLRISAKLENSHWFNNEFGVNVNWDPNKCRIIRDETGLLLPFSVTVKTLFVAFLGLRPVALG